VNVDVDVNVDGVLLLLLLLDASTSTPPPGICTGTTSTTTTIITRNTRRTTTANKVAHDIIIDISSLYWCLMHCLYIKNCKPCCNQLSVLSVISE